MEDNTNLEMIVLREMKEMMKGLLQEVTEYRDGTLHMTDEDGGAYYAGEQRAYESVMDLINEYIDNL